MSHALVDTSRPYLHTIETYLGFRGGGAVISGGLARGPAFLL
jgi:hypothetical protein